MSERVRKSEQPLCETCSNISLQELATDRGLILPHRWERLQQSAKPCPLCEAISGDTGTKNPSKPQLVIRARPGSGSPKGSPLRFLILGLSKGCPRKCNGEVETGPDFRNCKGICEVDYGPTMRIMTAEVRIIHHLSIIEPG